MKNILMISATTLLIGTMACNNNPPPVKEEKTIIRTETVEKPVREEPPAPQPAPQEEPGTSVNVGPGGVSVKSKKVDVKVSGDSTNLRISKPR